LQSYVSHFLTSTEFLLYNLIAGRYILRDRKDVFQEALAEPLGWELKARAMNTQMGGGCDEVPW
jgi:hypothetical protein